jgi:hypothetical protein
LTIAIRLSSTKHAPCAPHFARLRTLDDGTAGDDDETERDPETRLNQYRGNFV